MTIPEEFKDIRPFQPEELPEVYDRMLADPQFCQVLAYIMPGVPVEAIRQKMHTCKTSLDFQLAFCYDFLTNLLSKVSDGYDIDISEIDNTGRYTFVSNHRDIVLDSALLEVMLVDAGFKTTCEIAIGDNLLSLPWVKDLVRVNKTFIVKRSLPPREMLMASKVLSDYMHFVISEKHDNIWIAQREGRAKDSNDRTQPAILKMMAMGGGRGSITEKLKQLHIVPLSISYEFDPCDYLKARELTERHFNKDWKKAPGEDVNSMKTGIMGYKGRIHYHCAPCIDAWLDTLDPETPKTEVFNVIAKHIDSEIHRNYRLYPNNYIALDEVNGNNDFAAHYTAEDKAKFMKYYASQVAKLGEMPAEYKTLVHDFFMTMYANPARNYLAATKA